MSQPGPPSPQVAPDAPGSGAPVRGAPGNIAAGTEATLTPQGADSVGGHPDSRTLHDFAVGRLHPLRAAEVERHLESCERCGLFLADVPDDTLLGLAKNAAARTDGSGGDSGAPPAPEVDPRRIPPELEQHARYKIEKLLGAGGMGAVYKAEHRMMERPVALKVINPRFLSSPEAVERFLKEVKAAAKLNHPHIVASFDAEQASDLHFLAMEYVDGTSLDRLFAKPRRLPVPQVCQMVRHAALGLAHAHGKGMVHRDIKPQNMMLTRDGRVKLLDFGLARLAGIVTVNTGGERRPAAPIADDVTVAQTTAGSFLGTPDYVAPEQARDAASADARADIYSLGATFYFLLTGRPPFPGGSVLDKLKSHATQLPAPVEAVRDDVPRDVLDILSRMLAKAPDDRFQTAAEVAKALAPFAKGSEARPLSGGPASEPAATILSEGHTLVGDRAPATTRPRRLGLPGSAFPRSSQGRIAVLASLVAVVTLAALWAGSGGRREGNPGFRSSIPASAPTNTQGALSTTKNRRILFVLPTDQVWYADVGPVKARFEQAGYRVDVAGPRTGRCVLLPDKRLRDLPELTSDFAVDERLTAAPYDAIVFSGYGIGPFINPGPVRYETSRLILEFQAEGKVVGGLCVGQGILAHLGFLNGRRAAGGSYVRSDFPYRGPAPGPTWTERPLEIEEGGRLVTGRDDTAANAFADAVLDSLGR